MDEVVRFEDAVKDYRSKKIGPISFSVSRGEVVGLLGPNGSGKSTSIRMLLGLSRPSSGSVSLKGLDPLRDHVKALTGVGYSPELPNLQTFMTPHELLTLVGRELTMDAKELQRQVPEILESVGLLAYQDFKIGKLSKGMVQRLSVAQAMLGSPSLLILDEPMIGIDPAGVVHFRSIFRKFVDGGGTIIMSSHIMSEVESLCTSVAVIHSGRLLFRGPIADFIEESLNSRLITLEVARLPDRLVSRLQAIPGVSKVTAGDRTIAIDLQRGSDPRSEIARVVVEMDAGLLSLAYARGEIDEAYVAAIRGSAP